MSQPRFLAILLAACLWAAYLVPAFAAGPDVQIRMGQTIVWTVPEGTDRVVAGDGELIEVKPLPGQNKELLISAKKPGLTNFIIWPSPTKDSEGKMVTQPFRNYTVEVISSRRSEMVAIKVKVLQVDRTDGGKTGVSWSDSVSWIEAPPNSAFRLGLPQRSSLLEAKLNTLLQEGRAKLLAQPTLLTMNGASASFLAGGEVPIPLIVRDSASIEWKSYGVKLDVQPRVEGTDTIVLRVRPEVSRVDQINAIKLPTMTIPALATRWTDTTMQVRSGESIVLSGLMLDEDTDSVLGLPLLSAIPVLGEIFKSHTKTKIHTELVFFLTPMIVTVPELLPENNYGKR